MTTALESGDRLRGLLDDLDGLPGLTFTTDAEQVRRSSRDMSAMLSPSLAEAIADKRAAAVVRPRHEDELLAVLSACVRHGVPVVPRAAGTGNFGQSIPLRGGVVVDLTSLTGMVGQGPGWWRARSGSMLIDVDDALRPGGQELRVYPSSKRLGTVGGYVVGGHAGPGAIRHGVLADTGNILGLRVVTLEETPRILEIRGEDVNLVHFSFGTAGIVTEVEMPAVHAWDWRDLAITFPDLAAATAFGLDAALADGLDLKNVHPVSASVAATFTPLALPAGLAAAICMVAPHSRDGLLALAARYGGASYLEVATGEGPRRVPFYEFTWGHSILWARKVVPTLATVLALLPETDPVETLTRLQERLGEPTWLAVSVKRFAGRPALQVSIGVLGDDPDRIVAAGDVAASLDCLVADTHRPVLSSSSIYGFGDRQRAFKTDVDPHGLCNPGKLVGLDADATDVARSGGLTATGFDSRR